MKAKNFTLSVNVKDKPITQFEHNGNTFIEGRKGSDFTIEFRNNTGDRVLVVPSVDGLSPLDGNQATTMSPGYVVKPHSSLSIPGWTLNNNAVAKFQFQDKERGYAQSFTGSSSNAGVIGVAVYAENKPPVPVIKHIHHIPQPQSIPVWTNTPNWGQNGFYSPNLGNILTGEGQAMGIAPVGPTTSGRPRDILDVQRSTNSVQQVEPVPAEDYFSFGAGWGQQTDFKVNATTFDKGSLVETIDIYYDSRRNLERRGIVVSRRERPLDDLPQAFAGFGCKPPTGWKG